jgi:hypothetical protein
MRNLGVTFGVALIVCAVAFGLGYIAERNRELHRAAVNKDAMAWLHTEFHLSDQQFAAIKRLHVEYRLKCDGKCAEMMSARRRAASPDELQLLEAQCVADMLIHFQQVATLMPTGEGERYLASVLPYVAVVEDAGAPNMRLQH